MGTTAIAIVAGVLGVAGALLTLALKAISAKEETLRARDLMDTERERADHAEADLKLETANHAETRLELAKEKDLRGVAEANLNRARRQYETLLRDHLKDASDEEIRAATAAAFAGLDGVPPVPAPSRTGPDGLIDPFAEVPPP